MDECYFPGEEKKRTNKEFLKHVAANAKGKIFAEKNDSADETMMLEETIELVNSRCQEMLGKGVDANVSVENTDDQNFYKKLFCLLNGAESIKSKMIKKTNYGRKTPTTLKSGIFSQSVCSLEQRVNELEAMLEQTEATHQQAVSKYESEGAEFRARIASLDRNLRETEAILQDMTTEYCSLKDEIERKKREAIFREVAQPNRNNPSNSEHQISTEESSARAEQSLANVPTNVIERELHNNYKLLLLQISQCLLQDELMKLKDWATSKYSVEPSAEAFDILAELDNKGIISSSNLTVLKDFFEGITRIDIVVIIENFQEGNYSFLRGIQSLRRENQGARARTTPTRVEERWLLNTADLIPNENSIPRTSMEVPVKGKREYTHNRADEQSLQITTDGPEEQEILGGAHHDTGKFCSLVFG